MRWRWRGVLRNIAVGILLFGQSGVTAGTDETLPEAGEDPSHYVDEFHAVLLDVMQSGSEFEDRVDVLAPVVGQLFDLPTISRISLGRTWKTLGEAPQQEFSALLEQLIVATYADRFDSFSGQSFHTLSAKPARRGWVVKTELEKSDGDRVTLDYYFRDQKVFNVVAEGVSDLSLRRADYTSFIKTEGYDRLLAHIRENIANHMTADVYD